MEEENQQMDGNDFVDLVSVPSIPFPSWMGKSRRRETEILPQKNEYLEEKLKNVSIDFLPGPTLPISFLPRDCVFQIFSYLEFQDLLNTARTCRYFQIVSSHPLLWKNLAEKWNMDQSRAKLFREVFCSPERDWKLYVYSKWMSTKMLKIGEIAHTGGMKLVGSGVCLNARAQYNTFGGICVGNDESLIFQISFRNAQQVTAIMLCGPDLGHAPKNLKIYRDLVDFDTLDDYPVVQEVDLSKYDVVPGSVIRLHPLRFKKITSMSIYIDSNMGDKPFTIVNKLSFFGYTTR